MKDLLEYIAKSLVDDPSQVSVSETRSGGVVTFQLRVAPDDTGRVIGRNGRVANAIRTLLRVAEAKEGARVQLDIL